ncbi:ATP-binding cassette, subfamily B, MsbA [Parapedobacter luteus]|uniref:ATP-binding cassette, subfamily B, MsbA n=1 Tax=Parapedobacter luteus TaxID=623280 RepID=A0A1T5FQ37_9SPHI|nr:ABC transporter ATP-binding protein [Parapedobacter luteus]SKB98276.1 ATP-binding cassette, subfamily B, MsbA [Parapedobacter luteus]
MKSGLKHTPLGYFSFFYKSMGNKLVFNILLATTLGLLDGVGLALFIPLLQFVNDSSGIATGESMGGLRFILNGFENLGVPVNLFSVLSLMVIIFSAKGALNYWLSMEQVDLRQKYMVKLRLGQIKQLGQLSYRGFLTLDAGKIQNAITAEVGKNLQAMIQFLAATKASIVLVAYVVLAFLANWQFALFIMLGGFLSSFIYRRIIESVKTSSIEISRRGNLFNNFVIQCIHHFKYLKATNHFKLYAVKLQDVINEVEKLNRKIGKNQAITASTREPIIIFIVAIVILVQTNYLGASLGSILLSLLLFYRALNGLVLLQNTWQSFMQNVGGLQAVSDLSTSMQQFQEQEAATPIPKFRSQITLRELYFAYGEKLVLKGVDLNIQRNETIALVGESGSGKSTLVNIICALMAPTKGQLLVDGHSPYAYNIDSYRAQIGYITQEPIIFNDSVFNNVTFWAPPTTENVARFWEVIEKVALKDTVNNMGQKEDTLLGDNGMLISGGQKQRISIARELYKDVELLIMDEATSALDSETEGFVQESINQLKGAYTIIIIAHRLSTIKHADRIYLLEDGKISGQGRFEELIKNSSRFYRMASLQNIH